MKKVMGKYIWVVAVLVVVIGVYFLNGDWSGPSSDMGTLSPSPSPVKGSVVKPVVKKSPTPTPLTSSYTELVKEYEGRRIQFDERCQVTPQNPTYKNGTSIMIDNRSSTPRTITVGGAKYDLVAYGYRVFTLSGSNLPTELAVSCGSSGNVGKILLQAQILQ